jgi:hypothetical protein
MGFGKWNVRSLYRSGSLKTLAREFARYKLDVVGIQEVRWDKGFAIRSGGLKFVSLPKETKIVHLEQDFCTPQNSISR